MSVNVPKYPNDFYDFANGVDIGKLEIQRWIENGIDYLEEHEDAEYYYTGSGNTMVHVFRNNPKIDLSRYTVHVSKKYAEAFVE